MLQTRPSARHILRTTESRSARPMNPSSGEKTPKARLMTSRAIWSPTAKRGNPPARCAACSEGATDTLSSPPWGERLLSAAMLGLREGDLMAPAAAEAGPARFLPANVPRRDSCADRCYSEVTTEALSDGLCPWTRHPWLATVERRISPTAASATIIRPTRLPGIRILAVLSS